MAVASAYHRLKGWEARELSARAALASALAVVLLTAVRKWGVVVNPQFWAEDGVIFFQQAMESGYRSLFITYAGYYHTLLRLTAWGLSSVPVALAPLAYLLASLVGVAGTVLMLFSPRLPVRRRILMALCFAIVPHSGEVFLTLTNVQWYFALALALFLIYDPPRTAWQHLFDIVFLVVMGLTGPFALLFAPLFWLRAVRERAPSLTVRAVLASAAGAVQIGGIVAGRLGSSSWRLSPTDVLEILGSRVFGPLVLGTEGVSTVDALSLGLYTVALLAFLVIALRRAGKGRFLYVLAAGLLVIATAIVQSRHRQADLMGFNGDRYFFVCLMTVLWSLVQLLGERGRTGVVAAVVLALCAVQTVARPSGYLEDFRWPEASRCIGGPAPCRVPINPRGWFVNYDPAKAHGGRVYRAEPPAPTPPPRSDPPR